MEGAWSHSARASGALYSGRNVDERDARPDDRTKNQLDEELDSPLDLELY